MECKLTGDFRAESGLQTILRIRFIGMSSKRRSVSLQPSFRAGVMSEFFVRKDWMNIVAAVSLVLVPLVIAPGKLSLVSKEKAAVQVIEVAQES
jgi:hypothetical protein